MCEKILTKLPKLNYHQFKQRFPNSLSKYVYKSAAIATFQTNNENKSRFPKSFWFEGSEN